MNDEIVDSITGRYTELFEHLTGEKFEPALDKDPLQRIEKNVLAYLRD
jgi:phosphoribosylaminoimidazole-succinocarboxamide synthase